MGSDTGGRQDRVVTGVVDRHRLNRLLDEPSPRLCVVRAASGAGKTTLLRNWMARRRAEEPLLWLSFTRPASSRRAFWAQVAEAAQRTGDLSRETSAVLVGRAVSSPDPVKTAIAFLRRVGPMTLVLDAYEQLGEVTDEVDDDLIRLIEAVPDVRIVVGTRGSTRLSGETMLLRDRVRLIDDRQLALTTEEIAELLRIHLDRDDADLARAVASATGGYALGVRALILAVRTRGAAPPEGSGEWRELVATDLRSQLPEESSGRFALLTSVPPYVDVELATRISGRADAADLLETLERQGFGRWIPYARDHPVFQYVDSVRDAFLAQLRRTDPAGHRRAAGVATRWLFAYGDHEQAFAMGVEAEDYALASQVYVEVLRAYPESYITDRLLRPLNALPWQVRKDHPMLAFALGLARMANPLARTSAPEAFALAAAGSSEEVSGSDMDRFIAGSVWSVSLRLIGRFAESGQRSLETIEGLDRSSLDPDDKTMELVAMILRQLSYSLLQGGRPAEALTAMTRSAAATKVGATRNYALAYLVGAHGSLGQPRAARAARLEIDDDAWPREHERSYLNSMTLVGEGFVRLDEHDYAGALERAETASAYDPIAEFWPFVAGVATHARLGLGEALAEARRMEELLGGAFTPPGVGDNPATRYLANVHAICWLAAGRSLKAERLLDVQHARSAEVVPARVLHLLLNDEHQRAAERLARWLALPTHTVRSRAATLLLGAAAALRVDEPSALAHARRAYDLHLAHGADAHRIFVPVADRRMLAEAARSNGDDDLASYLAAETPEMVAVGQETTRPMTLTSRERVVLAALTVSGSREAIARALSVSPNTVKTQLRSIYRKLGVTTRAAALRAAVEHELLEPAPPASAPSPPG